MFNELLGKLERNHPDKKEQFEHLKELLVGDPEPKRFYYLGHKEQEIEDARLLYEYAKLGGIKEEIEEMRNKLLSCLHR